MPTIRGAERKQKNRNYSAGRSTGSADEAAKVSIFEIGLYSVI
jgi:hypothetical protein